MNCSPRSFTTRVTFLTFFCALILAISASSAGAASHACDSAHSTNKWKKGSVHVYAKHVKRGQSGHKYIEHVYTACSTKYQRRIVLEPDLYSGFSSFKDFRTNGRYLSYTVEVETPADGDGDISRLVDLKTGHSTRSLAAPVVTGATGVPCVGYDGGCNSYVASTAIATNGPGFAVASNVVGGDYAQPVVYHRIRIYCPNASITDWTGTEVAFGNGSLGPKTLHTDGDELKWKIFGVRGSADFC